METTTIEVIGMSCMGCVGSVKRALEATLGVTRAEVSLQQNQARVEFDPAKTDLARLKQAIVAAGYETP